MVSNNSIPNAIKHIKIEYSMSSTVASTFCIWVGLSSETCWQLASALILSAGTFNPHQNTDPPRGRQDVTATRYTSRATMRPHLPSSPPTETSGVVQTAAQKGLKPYPKTAVPGTAVPRWNGGTPENSCRRGGHVGAGLQALLQLLPAQPRAPGRLGDHNPTQSAPCMD